MADCLEAGEQATHQEEWGRPTPGKVPLLREDWTHGLGVSSQSRRLLWHARHASAGQGRHTDLQQGGRAASPSLMLAIHCTLCTCVSTCEGFTVTRQPKGATCEATQLGICLGTMHCCCGFAWPLATNAVQTDVCISFAGAPGLPATSVVALGTTSRRAPTTM